MTLRERLQDDTTAAMRSGDALRRDVLRMVQNAIYNIEKAKHVTLSEDEVLAVVTREVKTRRESVEAFRKGGREDLAAKEEAEIAILADYLPAAADRGRAARPRRRGRRRDRRHLRPRPGQGDGLALAADPRPRRRQGRLRARRPGARPRGPGRARHGALPPSPEGHDHARPIRRARPNRFTRRDAGRLIAGLHPAGRRDVGDPGPGLPARPDAARGGQARPGQRPGAARRRSTSATS